MLPDDGTCHAILRVGAPKTRGRAARHRPPELTLPASPSSCLQFLDVHQLGLNFGLILMASFAAASEKAFVVLAWPLSVPAVPPACSPKQRTLNLFGGVVDDSLDE